jgi:phosphatidylglycerophosphate synthase
MERLSILAPAAIAVGFFGVMLVVYTLLATTGRLPDLGRFKSNEVFGPFWAGFMVWLLRPAERWLIARGVSPTQVTATSLGLCGAAGLSVALGHLATGAWLFVLAGILDMLDGRIARATNRQTAAGALFDSVSDRWAELLLFAGFAWYLREHGAWFLSVIALTAGSLMVSYTRARGEALGLDLHGGAMQRAERIVLVSIGTLIAAWLAASAETAALAAPALGLALGVCAALSCATAIGRWVAAHRALVAKQVPHTPLANSDSLDVARAVAGMRASGEAAKVREAH